jgi:hypothetical protein
LLVALTTHSGLLVASEHPAHAQLLDLARREGLQLDKISAIGWLEGEEFRPSAWWSDALGEPQLPKNG